MHTFVTGQLISNEFQTTSDGNIYDRWLTLQIAPNTHLPIFDPDLLGTDLQEGQTYEMVLQVSIPWQVQYSLLAPSGVDLNVVQRTVRVVIDKLSRTADPIQSIQQDYPARAIILQTDWTPSLSSFTFELPAFRNHTFLLLQTAFGAILMRHKDVEQNEGVPIEPIQIGGYLEWSNARFDLLAVFPIQTYEGELRPQPAILSSNETIVQQMAGLPLLTIARQGATAWNTWRKEVIITRPLLNEVDLSKYDLHGIDLSLAQLSQADLSQSNLTAAQLGRADMIGATLRGTVLHAAHLEAAQLDFAHLEGADLSEATANNVRLMGANLTGAILRDAKLREATLWDANLTDANLSGADLTEADLSDANLTGAILDGANLRGAIYSKEQLAQVLSSKNILR